MVVFLQLLSVLILAVLGGVVWRQRPKDPVHIGFLIFSASLALWIASGLLANAQTVPALFFNKLVFVFPVILLASGLDLAVKLSHHKTKIEIGVWLTSFFVVSATLFTNAVVVDIEASYDGSTFIGYNIIRGSMYIPYILFLVGVAIVAFSYLLNRLRFASIREREQIYIVSVGLFVGLLMGMITSFLIPLVTGSSEAASYSFLTGFFIAFCFAYAIVKHDLFDIKFVAVRSAVYIGVLLSLSAIYYLAAYIFTAVIFQDSVSSSVSVSPFNITLALILAFLFQPLKRLFDRLTNRIFYRDRYKSEDFFGTLSNLLTSTTDLRTLLEKASNQIAATFKSEQTLFFVSYLDEGNHHISAGTPGHSKLPVYDVGMLDRYVVNTDKKIFLTEMLPHSEGQLRSMLVSHRVELVMPLVHEDVVVGYVLIGANQGGNYTKRDFEVLQATSNELVIAIQNSLSLHELKELNATLQQRINVATIELRSSNNQLKHLDEIKDEFISMASHQLRTPLTSVKGYLSMLLDGDAGNVTPKQQALLSEAYNSSERMVRLIADFLNISRLQSGKFIIEKEAMDIKELVKQETANLELIAKTRKIKFRLNITKETLELIADESKIQQVVMNFIDNSIYYSHSGGTVVINLERVGRDVAFTVVDTGIGVAVEDQPKLFHKFYRAKNARKQRPDGTGVGLFMARRVIEAHNGRIIFSSKEGMGSTFGFRIPLDGGIDDD